MATQQGVPIFNYRLSYRVILKKFFPRSLHNVREIQKYSKKWNPQMYH